jgi:dye decolorizing peroxidase
MTAQRPHPDDHQPVPVNSGLGRPARPPLGTDQASGDGRGISRRGLLAWGGGLLAAGGLGYAAPRPAAGASRAAGPAPSTPSPATTVPFHGPHQAGIATARPARLVLTSYDLSAPAGVGEVTALLQAWTRDARALTGGIPPPAQPDQIAAGLGPGALTVTVGISGHLLDRLGRPRPPGLADLPAFPGERLDPARSGGDLLVQVCADDPIVAFAAARTLTRTARPAGRTRWTQTGFFRTVGATRDPRSSPRNLMGQVDGTDDVVPAADQDGGPIWVASDAQPTWVRGGSYLVYRRIRMLLDDWDATPLAAQERVIGRRKDTGAPLGATGEHDPLDLTADTPTGQLLIPADAHARLANPASNAGATMHRRAFSYDDGLLPDGSPDAGLVFLAYQADPATGFTPVQQRLAAGDALNRFTVHTASALVAVLPGVTDPADWYGRALLASA